MNENDSHSKIKIKSLFLFPKQLGFIFLLKLFIHVYKITLINNKSDALVPYDQIKNKSAIDRSCLDWYDCQSAEWQFCEIKWRNLPWFAIDFVVVVTANCSNSILVGSDGTCDYLEAIRSIPDSLFIVPPAAAAITNMQQRHSN